MLQKQAPGSAIHLAIGPGARGCCYEVDEPVCRALGARYRAQLAGDVLRPAARRPGRHLLDLSGLAERIVVDLGISGARLGAVHRVCTICDPLRFESFRRDGAGAGRLRHFIRSV
jgi:copper oxidase (laccase) domain-containing protein